MNSDPRRLHEKFTTLSKLYTNLLGCTAEAGRLAREDMNIGLLQTYTRNAQELHAAAQEILSHCVRTLGLETGQRVRRAEEVIRCTMPVGKEVTTDGQGKEEHQERQQEGEVLIYK